MTAVAVSPDGAAGEGDRPRAPATASPPARWLLGALLLFFVVNNGLWLLNDRTPAPYDRVVHTVSALRYRRLMEDPARLSLTKLLTVTRDWPPPFRVASVPFTLVLGFSVQAVATTNFLLLAIAVSGIYGVGRRLSDAPVYHYYTHVPSRQDWKHANILAALNSAFPGRPLRIAVLPNDPCFEPNLFKLVSEVRSLDYWNPGVRGSTRGGRDPRGVRPLDLEDRLAGHSPHRAVAAGVPRRGGEVDREGRRSSEARAVEDLAASRRVAGGGVPDTLEEV